MFGGMTRSPERRLRKSSRILGSILPDGVKCEGLNGPEWRRAGRKEKARPPAASRKDFRDVIAVVGFRKALVVERCQVHPVEGADNVI